MLLKQTSACVTEAGGYEPTTRRGVHYLRRQQTQPSQKLDYVYSPHPFSYFSVSPLPPSGVDAGLW